MEIKSLKNGYKMQDAYERLYKRSKHFTIEKMDILFYPYLLMEFEVKYRGKLERLSENVLVMCDMWKGQYSIARSRGEFVMTNAEPFFIVECLNDDKEVFHILFDTVTGEYSLLNA